MLKLYEHQEKAIKQLRTGSILCGGFGSGKSITSLAYYFFEVCGGSLQPYRKMWCPRDLYIITTAEKRDNGEWWADAEKLMLFKDPENSHSNVKVTVDSWNNVKKYQKVVGAFFIFDEQRVVGSGAWVKAFYNITKKNRWILLSATPGDTWTDYIPVFVANGFFKNKSDFQTKHCVFSRFTKYPKIIRFIGEDVLEDYLHRILVVMKDQRKTVRHHIDRKCDYDAEMWKRVVKDRWDPWEDSPIQETGKLLYLMRRVANGHQTRIEKLKEILKEHPKVIVFYNFNYERDDILQLLTDMKLTYGECNGERHDPLPVGKKWVYIVQYNAGAEGWNCITCDTTVFYSMNYSYRMMEQASGRIDRITTPFIDLYYYHLVSDSPIDNAIKSALDKKEKFNERKFVEDLKFTI